ncbi:KAP family P-loop domain-containing protein [Maribacter sedimenticola]|uniref:KAP family P-loop domain-containing protein n=1 Tax=Maribacter sedimenticola TaxID=228956 RepID=A0ABY1SGE5_9FLAO|nr:P-loop NTPase fold protein [Maribacter sedimenticola]SNR45441.1 KAP family P-loop domain-containing protein [Maribacter sedimenticola]
MKKNYRVTFIFAGLLILFFNPIKNLVDKVVVNPVLSKIESNLAIDLIFAILLFLIVRKVYLNFKNKSYISLHQWIFSITSIGFYLFTRFYLDYNFYGFSFCEHLKYFDVLSFYLLIAPFTTIFSVFHKRFKKKGNHDNLFDDSPIKLEKEDALDRNYKAKRIANEIFQSKTSEAIGFGITGEWGSGKTSFLNLLKKEINNKNTEKDFILIDFNPWLNLGVEPIIKDFFDTIQEALRPYSEDVYREIKKYSHSILNVSKTNFTDSLKEILTFALKKNISADFKALNSLLKNLNKRVIIFIDDFDRLQSNEIFEILRLIRNTASFDCFVYVVAFDKDYLNKSLENLNIPKPEKFSEKIFLKEEHLIPVTQSQIKEFIKATLISKVDDKTEEIESYFGTNSVIFRTEGNDIPLNHLRDAKRFLNSFVNDYVSIKNEVVFEDYFLLKLLKFKFYDIYILLFLHKDKFLNNRGQSYGGGGTIYYLKNRYENDNNSTFGIRTREYKESILGKFMLEQLNYKEEIVLKVGKIMNRLFEIDTYQQKSHLSLAFERNYHKYFKDNLNIEDLSEVDFKQTLISDFEAIKGKIKEWKEKKVLDLVKYRFYELNIADIDSRENYEKIVKTIFYIANLEVVSSYYGQHVLGYDNTTLQNFISNKDNIISNKFYAGQNQEFKRFILDVLGNSQTPFLFESDFLNHVIDDNFKEDNFILSEEEIKNTLTNYLRDYLDNSDELSSRVWALFHNCKTNTTKLNEQHQRVTSYSYFDGAQDLLINFMKKDLDSFLVTFIEAMPFRGKNGGDNLIGVSHGIKNNIFGSFQAFEDWLNGLSEEDLSKPSIFKEEFLKFFVLCKENEFSKVEFDFKFPPAVDKLKSLER